MSDEYKHKNGNKFEDGLQKELIEELFRLAEVIHAPDGSANETSQEERLEAAQIMAELLKMVANASPEQLPRVVRHGWILDVLEDLVNFAEHQDLKELDVLLKRTHSEASKILQKN